MTNIYDKPKTPPIESLSPQNRAIMEYLTLSPGRGLSALIALTQMGIGSISKRIAELRALGFNIVDEMKFGANGGMHKVYRFNEDGSKQSKWKGSKVKTATAVLNDGKA